ncbi:MAG: MFS transporter [Clostridiales Family XIII bacterium]|nr:MFS transporter [Clostridiales Family XIII bacterium]
MGTETAKPQGINNFGKHGWGIVVYVFFLFWISAGPVDLLNVSVDAFAGIHGWDANGLLVFSSIGVWCTVVLNIIMGRWVVKKGGKIPTVVFLLLLGVFFIFNGFANQVALYGLAVVLLTAVSGGVNLISTNTYMSNWFPRKKGIALGWSSMGMCFSGVVSIPLFAALLARTQSTVAPYLFFGAAAIVIALITLFGVKQLPEEIGAFPDNVPENPEKLARDREEMERYVSDWTVGRLLKNKQVWLVSVSFGLLFIALMATMTQYVPRFVAAGFGQEESILWLSITSALGIPGSYLWGLLDQKTNTKRTVVIYAVYMMAMQFLTAVFFDNRTVTLVLAVLIGILIGGIGNLFPSMVIQIFGRYDFRAANSVCVPILTAIRACTFVIIAVVLGATMGNYRILFVILGVLSAVAVVLALGLSNKVIGKVA